jgi:hypothetical protein
VTDTSCGCSRPTTGGYLCGLCVDELEKLSAELPALIGLLYDHMGGQVRFNAPNGGGRASRATRDETGEVSIETGIDLPENAVTASTLLKTYLRGTTRLLMDAGAAHPIRMPADELTPMAWFLYAHLTQFRRLPGVYDLKEELGSLALRIVRVVDRPVSKIHAGICSVPSEDGEECPERLYAARGASFIRCKRCGHQHSVEARQGVMRAVLVETEMTAKELRAVLPSLMGVPLNPATFRSWKNRGRLEVKGHTYGGDELFRVGDVTALCIEAVERNQAKAG